VTLSARHLELLAASGITSEYAELRGYETVTDVNRLAAVNIVRPGRLIPGLLVPQLRIDGSTWGYQYRPDKPRAKDGKPVKYETPWQQPNHLDIPPGVGELLADPTVPLWVTEGNKKADCGAIHGLCIVALTGVWNWRGTNDAGGKVAVADWQDIGLNDRRVIIAFDGDVAHKKGVHDASQSLAQYLAYKGARPEYLWLPDTDTKTGLDDYLMEHSVDELRRLVKPTSPPPRRTEKQAPPKPQSQPVKPMQPVPLDDALAVFKKWLHLGDTAPIIAVAATVVANLTEGDPVWLLLVSPPSGGKTEILMALVKLPYIVAAATITEASLLSGTSKRERAADATGGLLRQVGDFGILLAKDFTSVLSQNRDTAKAAMAALREIYDGRWDRPVGTDGGKVLHWAGKCGFIGGVTPSYDSYQSIVNTLGDRFLLLRLPQVDAKQQAKSARRSAQHEKEMRRELSGAMLGLIAGADLTKVTQDITDDTGERLDNLAIFTACARTAVERDGYTKELLIIPQAEGPARLVKAMRQLYGGMVGLGVDDDTRWGVLNRVALDCAPAMRMPLMRALIAVKEPTTTAVIAEQIGGVTRTAGRVLEDLALLGIAGRAKKSEADNSANLWWASDWLREYWPEKVGPKSTTRRVGVVKEVLFTTPDSDHSDTSSTPLRTSRSYFSDDDSASLPLGDISPNGAEPTSANGVCRDCGDKPPAVDGRCDECQAIHRNIIAGYDQ
jgi:hypothetical protein